MAYETNLRGVLFKNRKKEKDTHPDYTGNCQIEGVDYFMDAWLKQSDKGNTFMSFSFKRKDKQAEQSSAAPQQRHKPSAPEPAQDSFDDDIPF
jgi:uncharacterized protein (DUF736 family)